MLENNLFVGPAAPDQGKTVSWDGPIDHGTLDFNGYYPEGKFTFNFAGTGYQNLPGFAAVQALGLEKNGLVVGAMNFASGLVAPPGYEPVRSARDRRRAGRDEAETSRSRSPAGPRSAIRPGDSSSEESCCQGCSGRRSSGRRKRCQMKKTMALSCFALMFMVAAAGCGDGDPPVDESLQQVIATPAYPPGPYGTTRGRTVARYQLSGFQNAQIDHRATQPIQLADFYNPHADDPTYAPATKAQDDRLFPAGSTYGGGSPKPRALSISISSLWCGACRNEAKMVLPAKHLKYKPLGGEFLVQLDDGAFQGRSAVQQDLLTWTTKFHVNYPATIDPDRQLDALFVANVYPANIIINTRNMKIVEVVPGVPEDAYWTVFEATLAGP